jgi:hypothetical protein
MGRIQGNVVLAAVHRKRAGDRIRRALICSSCSCVARHWRLRDVLCAWPYLRTLLRFTPQMLSGFVSDVVKESIDTEHVVEEEFYDTRTHQYVWPCRAVPPVAIVFTVPFHRGSSDRPARFDTKRKCVCVCVCVRARARGWLRVQPVSIHMWTAAGL